MQSRTAIYLSQRLQRPIAAILCLILIQLASGVIIQGGSFSRQGESSVRIHLKRLPINVF